MFNFDFVAQIYDTVMPQRTPVELLSQLNTKTSDKILEIGAGTGRIAKHYGYQVKKLFLLDPSEKMLYKARSVLPHAKLIKGVAENLPFADYSFDKIISYDSFHHWQNPSRGLRETLRVLKPGGKLFLVEVDPTNFWGRSCIFFEKIIGMGSKFYEIHDLEKLVKKIGFSTVKYDPLSRGLAYLLMCQK